MIYLDNAATTFPKPRTVTVASDTCLRLYSANPGRAGHDLSLKASEMIYNCRKKVKTMFGAKSEDRVIFTLNCTAALNMVLKGVLKKGDHVICSSLEHNAVIRPLNKLSEFGIEYDVARVFTGDFDATVRAFEALIKKNTKMIICTHASNVFGVVLPIAQIGKLCREYGLLFAVDCAQTAGVLEIDMQKMNIDYLCIAPHKGLYAPMGTGILIANADIERTIIEGGTGSLSIRKSQPDFMPDKFESGTVNLSGIAGISAGIDFVESKKINAIYLSEMRYILRCYDSMKRIKGVQLYTERPKSGFFVPVLSFNLKNQSSEEVGNRLNRFGIAVRPGLHCAPLAHETFGTEGNGTVRICPSVFTSSHDVDYFIGKIKLLTK